MMIASYFSFSIEAHHVIFPTTLLEETVVSSFHREGHGSSECLEILVVVTRSVSGGARFDKSCQIPKKGSKCEQ